MAGALLYQSSQRWRFGAALGAAALIHFAAIALASIHPREQETEFPPGDGTVTTVELELQSPMADPTPPPESVDPPTPNPTVESLVPEERSTPPPIPHPTTRFTPPLVKTRNASVGSQGSSSARVSALTAPRLEYPYEARRQKITGSGIAALTVDPLSGSVTSVMMEVSTGSPVLDNAAVTGCHRWRFKPGVSKVKLPITYTLTGAQY
jgi:TonB family protein